MIHIVQGYKALIYKPFVTGFQGFTHSDRALIQSLVADYDVPVSDYWVELMRKSRKLLGVTQAQLADVVGCAQPVISDLEKNKIGGSRFVPAICEALQIPLPIIMVIDEYDQRWVEAGRVLRERSLKRFLHYLAIFEEEAGVVEDTGDHPDSLSSDGVEQHSRDRDRRRPS